MDCNEIKEKLAKTNRKIQELNAAILAVKQGLKEHAPEDIKDILLNQNGLDPALVNSLLDSTDIPVDTQKQAETSDQVGTEATAKAEAMVDKKGVIQGEAKKNMLDRIRDGMREFATRSINYLPKGMNQPLEALLGKFAGMKFAFHLPTNVTVGTVKGQRVRLQVDDLFKKVTETDTGATKDRKVFEQGLLVLAGARGKDWEMYRRELDNEISKAIEKNPSLKHLSGMLLAADTIAKNYDVRRFIDDYYADLDAVRNYYKQHAPSDVVSGKEWGKDNYFHNIVAVIPDSTIFEDALYGKEYNLSNFKEAKKYDNFMEAWIKAGAAPSTLEFTKTADWYWKAVGNSVRYAELSRLIEADVGLGNSDKGKMLIQDAVDSASPAFVQRNLANASWEIPKDAHGNKYRVMSNITGKRLQDIYVHPEVYKWQDTVYRKLNPNGAVKAFFRANGFLKSAVLGLGYAAHAGSLFRKASYIAATTPGMDKAGMMADAAKGALTLYWKPVGIQAEGLSMVKNDDPILYKLIHAGLATHPAEAISPLSAQSFNPETGDFTRMTKLANAFDTALGWSHRKLFNEIHLGLKVGFAGRMVKSEYFKNLCKEIGEEKALKTVAQICNDNFGGQNLEAIGRSKIANAFLQAALLAPDWQNSKLSRLFGSAFAKNPEARKAFQKQMLAEGLIILAAKMAGQAALGAWDEKAKRSPDEMISDLWNGHFAAFYLGKDTSGREIFSNWGFSENEDFKYLLSSVKGVYESAHESIDTGSPTIKPLAKEVIKEATGKASPIAKGALEMAQRHEMPSKGPSPYDYPFLPMTSQQAVYAARGGFGGDPALEATKQAALSFAGAPTTVYANPEKKAKTEKRRLKLMKESGRKKKILRVLQ